MKICAVLNEEAFKGLINGREIVVEARGGERPMLVHLILEDIGFTQMIRLLDQAIDAQDPFGWGVKPKP